MGEESWERSRRCVLPRITASVARVVTRSHASYTLTQFRHEPSKSHLTRLQLSASEDGGGVTARVQGHGQQSKYRSVGITCPPRLCPAGAGCGDCRSHIPRFLSPCSNAMTLTTADNSASIFKGGKFRAGIYKIQNVCSRTYLDIREYTNELCGRPATVLKGKGLVGLCFRFIPIIAAIIIFSGKSSLWDLDTPSAEYDVGPRVSLPCTEPGRIARTRHARTILQPARWVRKRESYCHCHLSRPLEN